MSPLEIIPQISQPQSNSQSFQRLLNVSPSVSPHLPPNVVIYFCFFWSNFVMQKIWKLFSKQEKWIEFTLDRRNFQKNSNIFAENVTKFVGKKSLPKSSETKWFWDDVLRVVLSSVVSVFFIAPVGMDDLHISLSAGLYETLYFHLGTHSRENWVASKVLVRSVFSEGQLF